MGEEQNDHVLDRAGEDDADDDPDGSRQVAHLRGKHRSDQRSGTRDCREVVAEEHPPVGRVVIHGVVQPLRRRGPRLVHL